MAGCPPAFMVLGSKGLKCDERFVVQKYPKNKGAKGTRIMCIDGKKPDLYTLQRQGMVVPPGSYIRVAHVTKYATNLQRKAVEHVTAIDNHAVLAGGPGTGKTKAYEAIVEREIARKRDVLCIAPTATAASRLPSSMILGNEEQPIALHRAVQTGYWRQIKRVPYPEELAKTSEEESEDKRRKKRGLPRLPREVAKKLAVRPLTVIFDEYSMAASHMVDRLVQILENRGSPWRIILGGDWRQLRPVNAHSVWASNFAHTLIETGCPVYTLDACNWRFRGCERMQQMNRAFLRHDVPSIMEWIATLASAKLPDTGGNKRYVAYTAKQLKKVNDSARQRLVQNGSSTFTLVGGDDSKLTLADGELVKVCKNVWDRDLRQYTQRNGDKGVIEARGLSGLVRVTEDTRVRVRDDNGDINFVQPMLVGDCDDDGDAAPGKKRKRKQARYTFNRVLLAYTGFTVHSGQGDTMDEDNFLEVDLSGMPDVETVYTALSRHPRFDKMRVVGYDPARLNKILTQCPCGHNRKEFAGQRCNTGSVKQRNNWIQYLETHTVHIAKNDTLYFPR